MQNNATVSLVITGRPAATGAIQLIVRLLPEGVPSDGTRWPCRLYLAAERAE